MSSDDPSISRGVSRLTSPFNRLTPSNDFDTTIIHELVIELQHLKPNSPNGTMFNMSLGRVLTAKYRLLTTVSHRTETGDRESIRA